LQFITPGAVIISLVSLIILLYWHKTPLKKLSFFPASLVVVIIGIGMSVFFQALVPSLIVGQEHMVSIPAIDISSMGSFIHIPELSLLARSDIWTVAVTLAIVASLETLLNLEAVDKLDPHKRHSPPNKELIAQGFGNILAGFIGGIPLTSVIVRSSVNIQTGNKTKLSAIFHGILLLLSVLLLAPVMNMIPLASLAAILLVTGYKLANIDLFRSMFKKGIEQFIPFLGTVLAIVFTDLLIGVLVGLAISIAFLMISNFRNPYIKQNYTLHVGEVMRLELPNQVTFLNKASIKETLYEIPENMYVVIDATSSDYIDHDIIEIIEDFKITIAPERNILINVLGQKSKYQLKDHVQFVNVLGKDKRDGLSPKAILHLLIKGNERFVAGEMSKKDFSKQVEITSKQQNPMCVIIGCIDSRTTPEILFDTGLGDILTIRIAGNIITKEIIGSIEIACSKLGAKLIVVKAHSHCGAVTLAMNDINEFSMGSITSKIKLVAQKIDSYPLKHDDSDVKAIERVARQNAIEGVQEIISLSPYLSEKISRGELGIVSAYHDISTGEVQFDALMIGTQADTSIT
jgi:MFS superfamily sulfate permease-like transporter